MKHPDVVRFAETFAAELEMSAGKLEDDARRWRSTVRQVSDNDMATAKVLRVVAAAARRAAL